MLFTEACKEHVRTIKKDDHNDMSKKS